MRSTPAKVNLYLTVGALRPSDGRHFIRTVFHPIWDVCDDVSVRPAAPGEGLSLELQGRPIAGGGPNNSSHVEENLACRAVRAYCERFGIGAADFHVVLEKRIPVGAGLGGGSSDAAAALLEVDELLNDCTHATPEELHEIAAGLGADVPYFLNPVPALGLGIGDVLTPLPKCLQIHHPLLLLFPKFSSPVAWAYANWFRPEGMQTPPECPPQTADEWPKCLWNDLGFAVEKRYQTVKTALDALKDHGALNAIVSGSGPTVFGCFENTDDRASAKDALEKTGRYELYEG